MPDDLLQRLGRDLDAANRRVGQAAGDLKPPRSGSPTLPQTQPRCPQPTPHATPSPSIRWRLPTQLGEPSETSRRGRSAAGSAALEAATRAACNAFAADPRFTTLAQALRVAGAIDADTLASPTRLQAVLEGLAPWRVEPRRWRRCVRAVVQAWLAFDPGGPGVSDEAQAGARRLRTWLADALPALQDSTGGPPPPWVAAALAHPEFFGPQPFRGSRRHTARASETGPPATGWRPAEARTGPHRPRFGPDPDDEPWLCALGALGSPWVQRERLLAAVDSVCALPDPDWSAPLAALFERLEAGGARGDTTLQAAALTALAGRQARSALPLPASLRRALVSAWGAPWHGATAGGAGAGAPAAAWSQLALGVRQSATKALCREAIAYFFKCLVAASPSVAERAAHWGERADRLTWVHLALPADGGPIGPGAALPEIDAVSGPWPPEATVGPALWMGAPGVVVVEFGPPALGWWRPLDAAADLRAPLPGEPLPWPVHPPPGAQRLPARDGRGEPPRPPAASPAAPVDTPSVPSALDALLGFTTRRGWPAV